MRPARFSIALGRSILLMLLLAVFAARQTVTAAETTDAGPTLIILFDSSGSMWGQLPGGSQAKYAAARDALLQALPALDLNARTGLVTFGRGCNGVDVVLPPDVRPRDRTIAPINSLNPRGKGPLADALSRAAEEVEPGRRASLVVIHDGPDNCRQDTCTIAQRIAAAHPGMPIHLVSLGLDATETAAVSCIPEATGGKVFPVRSLSEVRGAIDQAIALAMTSGVPAPSPARRKGAEPETPKQKLPEIPADAPPHLVVSATLGDTQAVDKPVHWRIFREDDKSKPVLDILETQFAVPLPAGKYIVEAALGRAKATQTAEVAEKGPTAVTISFSAGIARVATRIGNNQTSKIPVLVSVAGLSEPAANGAAKTSPLMVIPSPSSEFVLPAGYYRITAESGLSRVTRDIAIKTAEIEAVNLDLSAGQLHLSAVSASGAPVTDNLTYYLSVDDPNTPGGRREVLRTAASSPILAVPAGTYYVKVRSGLYEKYDQIAVGAGSTVERAIILDAARLQVVANVSLEPSNGEFPIVYRVLSQGPYAQEVAMSWERTPQFTLPPGRYRIVAEIGARNVSVTQDIELAPGTNKSVTLAAQAAELRLRIAEGAGVVATNRFWEIRSVSGQIVWRTSQHTPRALLAPGRYEVRCELRDRTLKGTVELANGQSLIAKLSEQ
ncbi:Ca-activated chloride channel family protein [Filomicrobium insigne]|uniref:Ca-activated chloride channel family protein n=1 Tax=Filomicrobium insigne TaxID=418854 RepID=A0A1H0SS29_9HYPH|nr:VWA domain-containing protein [Filomicrobium insigne]SDP44577.1 Ca-activated chloride channel family protein [Filomicrobium insigne]